MKTLRFLFSREAGKSHKRRLVRARPFDDTAGANCARVLLEQETEQSDVMRAILGRPKNNERSIHDEALIKRANEPIASALSPRQRLAFLFSLIVVEADGKVISV